MNTKADELAKVLWSFHRMGQPVIKADCVIGLGSYDLRVADRCVELIKAFDIPHLIFSGAEGNWTRGVWKKTEAEVFKDRAIERGLDPGKILIEKKSSNIGENLRFCKALLNSIYPKINNIILVTKPQTERRVFATLPIEWPEIKAIISSPEVEFEEQPTPIHSKEDLINEMVGDLERIKVYPEKGFQSLQVIPAEVSNAFEELVKLGYTSHLLK